MRLNIQVETDGYLEVGLILTFDGSIMDADLEPGTMQELSDVTNRSNGDWFLEVMALEEWGNYTITVEVLPVETDPDDAGSGTDAGEEPSSAVRLDMVDQIITGTFDRMDRKDHYLINVTTDL